MLTCLSVEAACALMRLEGDSSSAAAAAAVSRAGEAASEALRLLRFALASCILHCQMSRRKKRQDRVYIFQQSSRGLLETAARRTYEQLNAQMKQVSLAERLWLTRLLWCIMLDDAAMGFEIGAWILNLKDTTT